MEEDRWKDKASLTEAETTPSPPPKERGQRWELRKEDTEMKRDWKLKWNESIVLEVKVIVTFGADVLRWDMGNGF